ncbi:Fe-S cluster assembly protein SufB, partial [Enterococcus sp. S181_ASV_20]|nr:Fe-S cluster assembly protein SufB [Enterococcus sp. S181_ASV_20]
MSVPEMQEEYQFGFHDDIEPVFTTGEGLSEEVIREISRAKGEPEWMLDFRLKSLETFRKLDMPGYGPDLSELDYDCLLYTSDAADEVGCVDL